MCISYKMFSTKTGVQPTTVERPWGEFRQFTHGDPTTVKILTVKAGQEFSLQTHEKRDEFWRVIAGEGTVTVGDKEFDAKEEYEFRLPKKTKHRIKGGPNGIKVLEISTGEFSEEDITRLQDDYGRA
jgi:mannose-6-phosphate isomerase